MSYHHLEGLARERQREIRRQATEAHSSRAAGGFGRRGRGRRAEQEMKVVQRSAQVVRLSSPAASTPPDTMAS